VTSDVLKIVGTCDRRLFGLAPAERLRRQLKAGQQNLVVADASAVLSDPTLAWLLDHPRTILTSPAGRPLAVAVPPGETEAAEAALAGGGSGFECANPSTLPAQFVRKLRRRDQLLALSLDEQPVAKIEREVFGNVYKGVTDAVTKWVWPEPAFHLVRGLSRLKVTPNMVTLVGLALTFVAAILFYRGDLWGGMAAAWGMTFLDTVDGKLARTTVTSSRGGDLLDHVTDYVHPPIWWYCLAAGLALHAPGASGIWASCWIILGTYLVGRAVEEIFKSRLGFNQYLWRRFDSRFRLVVSRRNIILLIMTAGLLVGAGPEAFAVAAAWSVASVLIQSVRLGQALVARRKAPLSSWLM
jgi:phosphatidylglycerophosphate synthase